MLQDVHGDVVSSCPSLLFFGCAANGLLDWLLSSFLCGLLYHLLCGLLYRLLSHLLDSLLDSLLGCLLYSFLSWLLSNLLFYWHSVMRDRMNNIDRNTFSISKNRRGRRFLLTFIIPRSDSNDNSFCKK